MRLLQRGILHTWFSTIVDCHFLTETIFPTMYTTIRSYRVGEGMRKEGTHNF